MAEKKGNRQLLVDTISFKREGGLTESVDPEGRKVVVGRGTFGQVDVPTANGRVYGRELMTREANKLRQAIRERKVFGEADHPDDGKTKVVRTSHIITELEVRPDGIIFGALECIRGTPSGDIVIAILEAGGLLGVSSRGYGTTTKDQNDNDVVNPDYSLLTYDVVIDPAASSAYPEFEGLTSNESVEPQGSTKSLEESMKTLAEVKAKDPALYESIVSEQSEAQAKSLVEAREAGRKEGAAQQEDSYKAQLPAIVAEIREKETKALKSDPKIAGMSEAMELIKPILAPYLVGGDAAKAIALSEAKVIEKDRENHVLRESIVSLKRDLDLAEKIGVKALLKLHLERRLGFVDEQGAHPFSRQVRRAVIDSINENMDVAQLEARIDAAAGQLVIEQEVHQRADREMIKLREDNQKLIQDLQDARDEARQVGIVGYVSTVSARSPMGESLQAAVLARQPKTKEEADRFIEEESKKMRPSKLLSEVQGSVQRRSRPAQYVADSTLPVRQNPEQLDEDFNQLNGTGGNGSRRSEERQDEGTLLGASIKDMKSLMERAE